MSSDPKPEFVPPARGDEEHASTKSSGSATGGGMIAGCGCLVAIGPMVFAFAVPRSGAEFGVLLTAPIGFIIAIVGMIVAVIGAAQSKPTDDTNATDAPALAATAYSTEHKSSDNDMPSAPMPDATKTTSVISWAMLVGRVRGLFIAVFALTAVVTAINVGNDIGVEWGAPMAIAVCTGATFPILPASWSLWRALSLKPDEDTEEARTTLHRLRSVQRLLAIGGGIWIPLLLVVQGLAGVLTRGMSNQPGGGGFVLSGLAPMVIAIVAWIVLESFANQAKPRDKG